jgi:hypothetical protein
MRKRSKENGSHYVALFDAFTVGDVMGFVAYLEFEDKIVM